MSEGKNRNQLGYLLELSDVQQLTDLSDFLRQEPAVKTVGDDDTEKKEEEVLYKDINEYICQNAKCLYHSRREELDSLHIYEVDANTMITICNHCYDQGYRFCLFTHEVLHIKDLDPVLEEMYAQPEYHQNQLQPYVLSKVNDLDEYFQIIGIDNPNPTHRIIDLNEEEETDLVDS